MTYTPLDRIKWNEIGENETHSTEQMADLKLNYKRLMIKLYKKNEIHV